jgi:hypothetical protein
VQEKVLEAQMIGVDSWSAWENIIRMHGTVAVGNTQLLERF